MKHCLQLHIYGRSYWTYCMTSDVLPVSWQLLIRFLSLWNVLASSTMEHSLYWRNRYQHRQHVVVHCSIEMQHDGGLEDMAQPWDLMGTNGRRSPYVTTLRVVWQWYIQTGNFPSVPPHVLMATMML